MLGNQDQNDWNKLLPTLVSQIDLLKCSKESDKWMYESEGLNKIYQSCSDLIKGRYRTRILLPIFDVLERRFLKKSFLHTSGSSSSQSNKRSRSDDPSYTSTTPDKILQCVNVVAENTSSIQAQNSEILGYVKGLSMTILEMQKQLADFQAQLTVLKLDVERLKNDSSSSSSSDDEIDKVDQAVQTSP